MPAARGQLQGWQPIETSMRGAHSELAISFSASSSQLPASKLKATPASQRQMAPSSDRRAQRNRVRDPAWVPRPRNPFIIFRCEYAKNHANTNEGGMPNSGEKTLSKRAAEAWKDISVSEKAQYKQMANDERDEHARLYPDYRFRPVKRQATTGRVGCPPKQTEESSYSQPAGRSGGRTKHRSSPTEDRFDEVAPLDKQGGSHAEATTEMNRWQGNATGTHSWQPLSDWQTGNDWQPREPRWDGDGSSPPSAAPSLLSSDVLPEIRHFSSSPAPGHQLLLPTHNTQQFLPSFQRRSSSVPPEDAMRQYSSSNDWGRESVARMSMSMEARMSISEKHMSISGARRGSAVWEFKNNIIHPSGDPMPGLRRSRSAMGSPPAENQWGMDDRVAWNGPFPTDGRPFEFTQEGLTPFPLTGYEVPGSSLFQPGFSFQSNAAHGQDHTSANGSGVGFHYRDSHSSVHVTPSPSVDAPAPLTSLLMKPDVQHMSLSPFDAGENMPSTHTRFMVPTEVFSVASSQAFASSSGEASLPPASPLSLVATSWNEPSSTTALPIASPIPTKLRSVDPNQISPVDSSPFWGGVPDALSHGEGTYGAWQGSGGVGPLEPGVVPSEAWSPGVPDNSCYDRDSNRALQAYEHGLDGLGIHSPPMGRLHSPPPGYSDPRYMNSFTSS